MADKMPELPEPAGWRLFCGRDALPPKEAGWNYFHFEVENAEPLYTADQLRERDRMWAERVEALERDARRLDWLNSRAGMNFAVFRSIVFSSPESWRAAIDAACSKER